MIPPRVAHVQALSGVSAIRRISIKNILAAESEHVTSDMCTQRRFSRAVWSESSLGAF